MFSSLLRFTVTTLRQILQKAKPVFKDCDTLKHKESGDVIEDTSALKAGHLYDFIAQDGESEDGSGEGDITAGLPWYVVVDGKGKALRQTKQGIEEALAIIEGPSGIPLACFPTSAPLEVPGITNAALVKESPSAPQVPKAPAAKLPKQVPIGQKGTKETKKGKAKGKGKNKEKKDSKALGQAGP